MFWWCQDALLTMHRQYIGFWLFNLDSERPQRINRMHAVVARRKTAHIDESLVGSIWAFHKTRLARNRRAVGIIALGWFCRRGRRRRRCRRLRACFGVFRRGVWIKRLLCRLIFCTGFGGVPRGCTPRPYRHRLFLAASRKKERGKQRQ